jgi:hypothetical protein
MTKGTETIQDEDRAGRAVDELRRLINGYQAAQALHVAAVLGIADHLGTSPRPVDELAAAVGAHSPTLYRLLRALSALGVFREHEHRCFSLLPMGACLRSDADRPMRPYAIFVGQEYQRQAWGRLLHSVRTGETAFTAAHGVSSWAYRERHPEQSAIYSAAMTGNSRRVNDAILRACSFGRFDRIADIGGGQGSLIAAILTAHPNARGVLFDLPRVVAAAVPELRELAARCDIVGGSMFDAVPAGCDAYLMKYVLHDWPDADGVRILENCRRAMSPSATLLVIERFVGAPNEDATGKLADLGMLVGPGGRERTREEFVSLLRAGGFSLLQVVPTATPLKVMVATPASGPAV